MAGACEAVLDSNRKLDQRFFSICFVSLDCGFEFSFRPLAISPEDDLAMETDAPCAEA